MRTTDAGVHTLDRRLDELRLSLNHLRQESITNEIQELVAGAGKSILSRQRDPRTDAQIMRLRHPRESSEPRES